MNKQVEEYKKKEEEATKATNKVKAEALVNKAYEAGKISNKLREKWIDKATKNYEEVEFELENLPVNMHVPVPINLEKGGEEIPVDMPQPGTLAYYKMQNKIKNAEARQKWQEEVEKYWASTTN
jgi:hypothetical protein